MTASEARHYGMSLAINGWAQVLSDPFGLLLCEGYVQAWEGANLAH